MTSFAAFSADEAPPSVPAYGLLPAADFRLVRGDREVFGLHGRSAEQRIAIDLLLDPEGRFEIGAEVVPVDPLKFKDSKRYPDRLAAANEDTGEADALLVVQGAIKTVPVVVACFEFEFLGGSMGSVVGERFVRGVKAALEQGALAAVGLLGQSGGFLNNPKVRIPLPGYLNDAAKLMKRFGQGQRIEELETSINRAAEAAVPMGKDLLVGAVRSMTVTDAKNILTGGDNSVTAFFAEKTRTPLGQRFLPVVTQATDKVGLTQKYNAFAGKAASFGLLKAEDANLAQYVTGKTLDGLYLMIGEEERKIRQDPAAAGSAIARKVFGALR